MRVTTNSSRLSRSSGVGIAACLTIAPLLALPQSASAQIPVFSTFGVGNTFNSAAGWGVTGSSTLGYTAMAMAFTPSSTVTLTSVEVGGTHVSGTNSFDF